jgi:small GTP-binding protein
MPTNLPPEYFAADKRFREAESTSAKIIALEEMMGTIPKHKGTDKLRAELRRKISKLKSEKQKKKGASKHESEYHIEKEGAGRIVIVGLPNVGKSSMVASLTHAAPKISESPFTTWQPMPGMTQIEDIQVQLIDTPPLNREHTEPELFDLLRTADLILIVIDLQATPFQQFEDSLLMLKEHKIIPKQRENKVFTEQRVNFVPVLIVVNKDDDNKCDEDFKVFKELLDIDLPLIPISIQTQRNIERLKVKIFELLEIIRIYSKPPGKEAELTKPFVIKKGCNVEDFANKVHHDFSQKLKTARVWGSDVFDGQLVGRDHILHDKDIVELHL